MNTFQEYFNVCLSMAANERQREIMWKCMSIYEDYFDQGLSPSEAMLAEGWV